MADGESGRTHDTDAIGLTAPASTLGTGARYEDEQAILGAARQIGEEVLGPRAQETDQRNTPDPANFRALAAAGLLGLAVPKQYGGLDASGATQRAYTQLLASYCGVTTFTQAQHHGPVRMIYNGPNELLKAHLLPRLADGRSKSGISFAHLRRPGPPVLRADPCEGGYRLNGTAPWVTGWRLIDQLVFGATLPNGRFVYLWSPARRERFPEIFADVDRAASDGGTLEASHPLPLCAMSASATVELTCREWFIPEEHKLSESDRETMQRNDRNGVLGATSMPLGCALGALRVLEQTAERRALGPAERAARSLRQEWEQAVAEVDAWGARGSETEFFDRAIAIRAWCIELAVRAALAAVAASSGAANTLSHPAQRLYREAMFYAVQAQTREVMDATLLRLERK